MIETKGVSVYLCNELAPRQLLNFFVILVINGQAGRKMPRMIGLALGMIVIMKKYSLLKIFNLRMHLKILLGFYPISIKFYFGGFRRRNLYFLQETQTHGLSPWLGTPEAT